MINDEKKKVLIDEMEKIILSVEKKALSQISKPLSITTVNEIIERFEEEYPYYEDKENSNTEL